MRDLAVRLREVGPRAQVHIYPGAGHWFAEHDRPDAYDRESAELAYCRTVEFIRRDIG